MRCTEWKSRLGVIAKWWGVSHTVVELVDKALRRIGSIKSIAFGKSFIVLIPSRRLLAANHDRLMCICGEAKRAAMLVELVI